jgi:hypothetical protein
MARGKDRDLAFNAEVFGVEPGEVVERAMHDCHVGVPVAQQPCLLADLAQEDLDRCRTGFARKRVKEPSQQLVGSPGLRREHQRPRGIPGTPRPTRSGRDRIEGPSGLAEQHPAGVGERHSSTVPIEELNAEPLLQLADRARQRRLCDPEANGGASKVQFLGNGDEVPELTSLEIVHGRSLPPDTWRVSELTESILDNERATGRAWIE